MSTRFFLNELVFVIIDDKRRLGTIKFIGEMSYSKNPEIYYGIELQTIPKSNTSNIFGTGTLNNIRYFDTKDNQKSALFVAKAKLRKYKTDKNSSRHAFPFTIDDRVYYITKHKDRVYGIIRFIGVPYTANSEQAMFGILLSKGKGNHNGYVNGRHYFECVKKYGVFATIDQIKKAPILNVKWKIRKKYNLNARQVLTTADALDLLICGYCHRFTKRIPNDLILRIVHCCKLNKTMVKYMEMLHSDKEHKELGTKCDKPIAQCKRKYYLDNMFAFNAAESICVQCSAGNSLEFHCSYQQQMKHDQNKVFLNNANEYKCNECGYYTAHNVKQFVIQYYKSRMESSYHYISPSGTENPNMKEQMNPNITDEELKQCSECKSTKNAIQLVHYLKTWEGHRTSGGDSRYVVFCKACKLFSCSGHHM